MIDHRLELKYANPSAEMLLEASMRRLSQLPIEEWFALCGGEREDIQACLATGHPYTRREAKLKTLGGNTLTVDYSINPVLQPRGENLLLIEIEARDRLMRIEREEDLLSQHATARSLVRGMAHEIKNPLGGIRGAAQLLERELDDVSLHDYTHVITPFSATR